MDNFEDLKQIWLSQKTADLPSVGEMRKLISVEKNRNRRKISFSIAAIVVLLVFMALIMFFSEAKLLSTLLGEALMLAAIFILLTSRINSLRRAFRNENISNREFIEKLKSDIERLTNDWNTVQKTGFAFIGAGYMLFLYESVYQNTRAMIIGYSITVIFLSAAWFFLRPLANRRKLEKKELLLEKTENLSQQIKE
jgi:DMSO/TMAO reductase YedYZ heme-binding membrane subunit